jgi:hypothetical protein
VASSSFRTPGSSSASRSGVSVVADTKALGRLARDLRRASPEAWKALRVSLRATAQPVLEDARARASFSKRIPGSMRIVVTSGGNVKIVAGGEQAPDAAAIENRGKGFVRHPVFGNRERWTSKNSRPAFLAPAFDAHKDQVAAEIEAAVAAAVDRAITGR